MPEPSAKLKIPLPLGNETANRENYRAALVQIDVAAAAQGDFDAHKGAGGTAHREASADSAGFLSAADKRRLDLLASLPAGAEIHWPGDTPPDGFLEEDGSAISRTTYAALFAVIGTRFGAGDGVSTFNVPDSRGRHYRAWDHGKGLDPGRANGSDQEDAMQGHWHNTDAIKSSNTSGYGFPSTTSSVAAAAVKDPISDGTHGTPRIASETRGKNTARMACIKY